MKLELLNNLVEQGKLEDATNCSYDSANSMRLTVATIHRVNSGEFLDSRSDESRQVSFNEVSKPRAQVRILT